MYLCLNIAICKCYIKNLFLIKLIYLLLFSLAFMIEDEYNNS